MKLLEPEEIHTILARALPGAKIFVEDLTGTRDHYKVVIVSDAFDGKTLLQRHRVVNEALAEPLKGPLHALAIEAYTTAQWDEKNRNQLGNQGPTAIKF